MTIEIGTIIHGTLRDCDLVPAFMSVLREEAPEKAERIIAEFGQSFVDRVCDPHGLDYSLTGEIEDAYWLTEMLWNAMEDIAPEGTYFGAIEGDASDFGFWPIEEEEVG